MASEVTITITTQSQPMHYMQWPALQFPQITLNGVPVPQPRPCTWPTGFRLVLIDSSRSYTDPASILVNKYFLLHSQLQSNSWMSTYIYVYNELCRAFLTHGNIERQLVLLASFGLDYNMGPTNEALRDFLNYGGGAQLQKWSDNEDIGSQVGNPDSWVSFPGNYILIGNSSFRPGEGHEKLENGSGTVVSTLSATLFNPWG